MLSINIRFIPQKYTFKKKNEIFKETEPTPVIMITPCEIKMHLHAQSSNLHNIPVSPKLPCKATYSILSRRISFYSYAKDIS